MTVRPINAINLKKYIKGLDVTLPYDEQDKDDVIRQVCCIIGNWPTLTPPNEPEYREYACPYCSHTWLEDRDASDYPNYCPVCGAALRDGSTPPNEALTCEELRKMNEEPVWIQNLEKPEESQWRLLYWDKGKYLVLQGISVRGYLLEEYGESWFAYRRPPEGEEGT